MTPGRVNAAPGLGDPLADLSVAFERMQTPHLPAVLEVEKTAYSHPWNERHFRDSMDCGHLCCLLVTPTTPALSTPQLPDGSHLLGHMVAMQVLDETHLLNLTVAPAQQRRGWGRLMLQALALRARADGSHWLWLEVRQSNSAAQALYRAMGFHTVGERRDYYPHGPQGRENAVIMSLNLRLAHGPSHPASAPLLP